MHSRKTKMAENQKFNRHLKFESRKDVNLVTITGDHLSSDYVYFYERKIE